MTTGNSAPEGNRGRTEVGLIPALLVCAATIAIVAYFMAPIGSVSSQYSAPATTSSNSSGNDAAKRIAWTERGQAAVRERLRDPKSASFRNVRFNRGADGIPMTCGEVNSKNAFGGYTGFQRFVSGGSASTTFLEEQVEDFDPVWSQFCP